jgi:glucokinase
LTAATSSDGPRRGFAFPVLLGDIGGTNARFSVLQHADGELLHLPIVQTADFATIDDAVRKVVLKDAALRPRSTILAIAAPVEGDEIPLTNSPWLVRPRAMLSELGQQDVVVLNDFEAQALAVLALGKEHMDVIVPGRPEENAGRVVLGPGTGLGVAGLVHAFGGWVPVPGEGGHMDIGPRNAREYAIFPNIEPIQGRVSGEQILSGRGLVRLYNAIAATDGLPPRLASPSDISGAGLDGSDRIAVEALDLFVTCLGRLAGDLALVFKSTGGVYLTGGIAQKILPALKTGRFRTAFENKGPHGALMREMPVYVITHPLAALYGLAAYAAQPLRFGIETAGRRWLA